MAAKKKNAAAKKKAKEKKEERRAELSVSPLYSERGAHGFFDDGKRLERVRAILGGGEALDERHNRRYYDWLKANFRTPCDVVARYSFGWEESHEIGSMDSSEYRELKKTRPSEGDSFKLLSFEGYNDQDILIRVRRNDRRIFEVHLAEIECSDEESPEHAMLTDYMFWRNYDGEHAPSLSAKDDTEELFDADEARIRAILGDDTAVSEESCERYLKYLTENLSLPVRVEGVASFEWEVPYLYEDGDPEEYRKRRETTLSSEDECMLLELLGVEERDIRAKVVRCSDGKEFTMGLSWFQCFVSDDPACQMLDDFSAWCLSH